MKTKGIFSFPQFIPSHLRYFVNKKNADFSEFLGSLIVKTEAIVLDKNCYAIIIIINTTNNNNNNDNHN